MKVRNTQKMSPEAIQEACELLIEGHAPKSIAPRWNISPTSMLRHCRLAGLSLQWVRTGERERLLDEIDQWRLRWKECQAELAKLRP
jgi:hypothetical protein